MTPTRRSADYGLVGATREGDGHHGPRHQGLQPPAPGIHRRRAEAITAAARGSRLEQGKTYIDREGPRALPVRAASSRPRRAPWKRPRQLVTAAREVSGRLRLPGNRLYRRDRPGALHEHRSLMTRCPITRVRFPVGWAAPDPLSTDPRWAVPTTHETDRDSISGGVCNERRSGRASGLLRCASPVQSRRERRAVRQAYRRDGARRRRTAPRCSRGLGSGWASSPCRVGTAPGGVSREVGPGANPTAGRARASSRRAGIHREGRRHPRVPSGRHAPGRPPGPGRTSPGCGLSFSRRRIGPAGRELGRGPCPSTPPRPVAHRRVDVVGS
jgi:hypothetical protein